MPAGSTASEQAGGPENHWQRRKDARPAELLAAALTLFVERGYAATRLQDIAERAGVTKGTVYRYFKNKDALFNAVAREHVKSLAAEIELVAGADCNSSEQLRKVIKAWWQQVRGRRTYGLVTLLMAEGGKFPQLARYCHEQTVERYRTTTSDILKRAVAKGEFRPVDIASISQLLITPVLALLVRQYTHGSACQLPFVKATFPDDFLDFMLRGLLADRDSPGAGILGMKKP